MSIKLGIVMDPIQDIHFHKDSTLAMMLAARARGMELFYMTANDLSCIQGIPMGRMCKLDVFDDENHWFECGAFKQRPLTDLDGILMRKDPPFDMNYIYSTYVLDLAENQGVYVMNSPQALRDHNEKFFTTHFSDLCPPTLVSAQAAQIKDFIAEHQACVLKPLDGMGGMNIFRVNHKDANTNVIIQSLTFAGKTPCMVQRFIPEITQGDKRVLMIGGEPIGHYLARIPRADDFRGNLAAGATGEVRPLGETEKRIAEKIGPTLVEHGLDFVGLDIIGDYLTEINVTSPTCIREIEKGSGEKIAEAFIDLVIERLQ